MQAHVGGSPTPEQERMVLAALEAMEVMERLRARPSAWKLAGRAVALRVGASDIRRRMPEGSLRAVLPWSGATPSDLRGRGDAK